MTLPKFIITMEKLRLGERSSEIGVLRLGMVNQHRDLLRPGDQCIGGGYYTYTFKIEVQFYKG